MSEFGLLPCPFCGGSVEYIYHVGKTGNPRKFPHTFNHTCEFVGFDKRFLPDAGSHIRKWISAWNDRMTPTPETTKRG